MKATISMCIAVQLVLSAILRSALPAPVTTPHNDMDDVLADRVETSLSLIKKIVDEIPGTHQACIQVDNPSFDMKDDLSRWQYMSDRLGLPTAPNLTLSSSPEAEVFSQILAGLQTFKAVLETTEDRLSNPGPMKDLLADLKELVVQIRMVMKHVNASLPTESESHSGTSQLVDYEVQVTAHVTLVRLERFGQEVLRFLRSLLPNDA